jgi:hypothetical protein
MQYGTTACDVNLDGSPEITHGPVPPEKPIAAGRHSTSEVGVLTTWARQLGTRARRRKTSICVGARDSQWAVRTLSHSYLQRDIESFSVGLCETGDVVMGKKADHAQISPRTKRDPCSS